ncbi:hypothetical protein MKW94_003005 [Papaver nudicaule]|uniref:BHLH domain-containing protein n=1 Tax=Papaver nudicaule TaxID=74823 RepID=A0AA41S526_PAPNU|nr:hypothetical protein [Papaver nudicaule]
MALEVFPQELFGYGFKDLYNLLGGGSSNFLSYDYGVEEECKQEDIVSGGGGGGGEIINHSKQEAADTNWDISSASLVRNVKEVQETNSSSEIVNGDGSSFLGFTSQISEDPVSISTANTATAATTTTTTTTDSSTSGRRKRRRAKSNKNKEEVENQRMTHIAVERNRRRQMNEYLAVLRSLMPPSYVQRGDQASIIGGAINFVKELEQLLQSLESQKQSFKKSSSSSASPSLENAANNTSNAGATIPFADFFTYPQYSSHSSLNPSSSINSAPMTASNSSESLSENHPRYGPIADIEVTMVESHANLKILTKRRPKQLLKLASGFQTLRLGILHLNVTTTVDQRVLYSFSVKVEEDCQLTSVDEIATAVYQMIGTIQDETCRLS